MNESTRRNNRRRRAREAKKDMALLETFPHPLEYVAKSFSYSSQSHPSSSLITEIDSSVPSDHIVDSAADSFVSENLISPVKDLAGYLSESSDSETGGGVDIIKTDLCKVFATHNVKSRVVNGILKTLKSHACFQGLPSDSRSLLGTPRETDTEDMGSGKYIHFGLRDQMQRQVKRLKALNGPIMLQVFIDGLPISKSTNGQFWTILACILGQSPFPVGIYYGTHKPEDVNVFLRKSVNDLEEIISNGMSYQDKTIPVRLHCFICDAPARSFATCTKGHTGFFPCIRCNVRGENYHSRTVFPELISAPRTNDSFRRQINPQHHHGKSEIERLELDIVRSFPGEYMHLICLGIVKKLIRLWLRGSRNYFRMSASIAEQVSADLKNQAKWIPHEFQRKPRSLEEVDRWKATECRQFLLYTGPLVLRGRIPSDNYLHFLCLHVAVRILVKPTLVMTEVDYAESLLQYFVQQFPKLYGKENMSFNVHGLLHLATDARNLGPLDQFSAFRFESYLGKLKNSLRSHSNLLQQVHRRLVEIQNNEDQTEQVQLATVHKFRKEHSEGPCLYGSVLKFQYKVCDTVNFSLSTNAPDNVCMGRDGVIILIKNIGTDSCGRNVILGYESQKPRPFFA